jgi:hypothetical protein
VAFKTFVDSVALPASDLNTYLMKQANIGCTSGTRPTGVEGMSIYETDTDKVYRYTGAAWVLECNFGAWDAYTPTFSGTTGNGTVTGAWTRLGRLVHYRASITWGSSTSHAAATQTLTLPVTAETNRGSGEVIVDQGGTGRRFHAVYISTTAVSGTSEVNAFITNVLPITTWATGHSWQVFGWYEAAS